MVHYTCLKCFLWKEQYRIISKLNIFIIMFVSDNKSSIVSQLQCVSHSTPRKHQGFSETDSSVYFGFLVADIYFPVLINEQKRRRSNLNCFLMRADSLKPSQSRPLPHGGVRTAWPLASTCLRRRILPTPCWSSIVGQGLGTDYTCRVMSANNTLIFF